MNIIPAACVEFRARNVGWRNEAGKDCWKRCAVESGAGERLTRHSRRRPVLTSSITWTAFPASPGFHRHVLGNELVTHQATTAHDNDSSCYQDMSLLPLPPNPFAHLPSLNPLTLLRMSGLLTHKGFDLTDTPDLSGKIAVITGGQAGIGREIVAQLLLHGISRVYILARTESRYEEAKEEWLQKHGLRTAYVEERTAFIKCDLGDLWDVKRAADELLGKLERLDVLINNAALPISTPPRLRSSSLTLDPTFATNHLGHFVLTNLLLPLLRATPRTHNTASSRIVTSSSSLHLLCRSLDLNLLTASAADPKTSRIPGARAVEGVWRYARSKLANILFTRELARRLEPNVNTDSNPNSTDNDGRSPHGPVYANAFFPGNVATEAMDAWSSLLGPLVGGLIKWVFGLIGQSPEEAAATAVFLAAAPGVEKSGRGGAYYVPVARQERTSLVGEDVQLAGSCGGGVSGL
ncbi:hypothetical protein H2199_008123 [Coniosporium tulheliwenetii]|uniref:Uncharacterized protein n=1 Tax=Coniosporium tulheliwenetii TaxID=3383036 RepID=A0ACC2YKB3_9PEZI|nr:hypothetical protein H2199_008123 [Cladosporium sp. JES 115]